MDQNDVHQNQSSIQNLMLTTAEKLVRGLSRIPEKIQMVTMTHKLREKVPSHRIKAKLICIPGVVVHKISCQNMQ